jgi:hypothetical protein
MDFALERADGDEKVNAGWQALALPITLYRKWFGMFYEGWAQG